MSTDWAVTTRAILGPEVAAALWPDHAEWAATVLDARETLRQRARSFWLASMFLAGPVRDDLALLYAFCRMVDDAADTGADPVLAADNLDRLREELLGRAVPSDLVAALRAAARRRSMALDSAVTLIEGVRSDLGPVRIADEAELIRYAYRVAGTVGLLLCGVLDARPRGRPHAVDLGIAMQLTNIVRDVQEDALLGRVYLPLEWLRAEGVDPESIGTSAADDDGLIRVLARVLDLADRYYRSADAGIRDLPAAHRPAILVASRVYGAIGRRARRRPGAPLRQRVVVSPAEKVLRTLQALGTVCTPAMLGLSRRIPHDPALHRDLRGWPGTDPSVPATGALP